MTSSVQIRPRLAAKLRFADGDGAQPLQIEISNDSVSSHGFRLIHTDEAIDLSRAQKGLPLLVSHDTDELPIGRAVNVRRENNALVADLKFGSTGAAIETDMRAGIITDVSVGADYDLSDAEVSDDIIVLNRWRPVEVSAVSIGAIDGASVRNQLKVINMSDDKRLSDIKAVFAAFDGPEYDRLRLEAIDQNMTVDQARDNLLSYCAAKDKRTEIPSGIPSVSAGEDARDKFQAAAEVALRYRASAYTATDEGKARRKDDLGKLAANEYRGLTLLELARESLRLANIRTAGLTPHQIADLAIRGTPQTWRVSNAGGHTSSDFTSLISGTANKQLAAGYDEADESWSQWTSTVSMSNYQQHLFPNLSSFGDLAQRREGGAYSYGTFSDKHEVMTLREYGKRFSLDRQTIINDDLNAFTRIPMLMGRAASRNVGDLVYAVLTTGTSTAMNEDAVNLFNVATHANYVTSGAAPSVTTLDAGLVAMGTQTDPGGATIGIRPRYLIVPLALESTSRVLLASANDPAITPETPNPFRGAFTLVSDYRLDAFNSSGWFLAAAAGQTVETVAVGFLDGQQSPTLNEEQTYERPGVIYTVQHDVTAAALDWRGLYYNDGVT